MNGLNRILKEPIVHFLIIGGLLFGLFAFLTEDVAPDASAERIVVDENDLAQLVSQFEQTWRRRPNTDELDALIAAVIREEVLVREALSLSMDADDPVIRRRLAQKMEFLIESGAASAVPSDEEIRTHYEENIDAYSVSLQIGFEQIFLGAYPSEDAVSKALSDLAAGRDPAELGERTLLPGALQPSRPQAVDGAFGRGFFSQITDFPPDVWAGPVRSGYGDHAVRVTNRVEAEPLPLEAVRSRVEADWRAAMIETFVASVLEDMEARYEIERPSVNELEELLR